MVNRNRKRKENIIIALFLAPSLLIFTIFILYPVFNTIYLSFHSWKGIYGSNLIFVGFDNYIRVLKSEHFYKALLNSLYFLIGGFAILMPLSFLLALLITSKLKYTKLMKTSFFMPIMLSITAVALMWVYILNPTFGAVNTILRALGLNSLAKEWLSTPTLNVWSIVLVNEWTYAGYNMLIFASGLISIPKSIYESADIDGCNDFQLLFKILFPVSIPIISTEAILSFIYGYGELIFAMILFTDESKYTVARSMLAFSGSYQTSLGPIFACIIIAVLPMIILYIFFHEKVQDGMMSGAIKG